MSSGERPRSVGPARAAAILYGDWGTSKAYVLGIAFALAGFASFPVLVAMAALTALVGLNYYWVCTLYPDGGGVYSAVRTRSRLFATIGALLLVADYLVTASLSVLEGFNYLAHLLEGQFHIHLARPDLWAIGAIALLGLVNFWGPRHSGSLAVILALPASLAAASIALIAIPHLSQAHFETLPGGFTGAWGTFAGIVLALSGVEAVSNMTGVMTADPKTDPKAPDSVRSTARWALLLVATEVVVLTILLAWAMHAMPADLLDRKNPDAMLGQMADHYGRQAFGAVWGVRYATAVGAVMALLLLSAGNTAIIGMISVFYMMASDREMPAPFSRLNRHGVPQLPLILATLLPCILLLLVKKVEGLAALYAIGVVGAITINLGACSTNRALAIKMPVRLVMGITAIIMLAIWVTVGVEKHEALIFAITILACGLVARSFVQERRQSQAEAEMRELMAADFNPADVSPDIPRVLVAVRGVTETLRFAIEETKLRGGRLGVLFVREVNVIIPVPPSAEADEEAVRILHAAKAACDIPFDFLYRTGDSAAQAILQTAKEYQADFVVLGASGEGAITHLLRGSVVTTIAENLPRKARLLIYSWRPKESGRAGRQSAPSDASPGTTRAAG